MNLPELRKYLHAAYIDLRLFLTGKSDPELPPLRLRDVGGGDFRAIGEALAAMLVRHGLRPEHRVLDIGSGVGRVALPLTRHLTAGRYDGVDVVARWVRWCVRNITPRHPNFRFTHANVYNSHYNRGGVTAARYRLPFDDGTFDFAFATSVFTHLDPESARNYTREAHRVLRPGGILVATFFLWDDSIVNPALAFPVDRGTHRLLSATDPDWGIAFRDEALEDLLSREAWTVDTIERGRWRGGTGTEFQDVIVARKRDLTPLV